MDAYQLHTSFSLDFDALEQEEEDGFHRRSTSHNRLTEGALSPITLGRLEAAWREDHDTSSSSSSSLSSSAADFSPPRSRYGYSIGGGGGGGGAMQAPSFSAHRRTPTFSTEVNEVDFDFFSTPSSSRAAKAANLARKASPASPKSPSSQPSSVSRLQSAAASSSSFAVSLPPQSLTTPRRNANSDAGHALTGGARPVLTTSSSGQASLLDLSQAHANPSHGTLYPARSADGVAAAAAATAVKSSSSSPVKLSTSASEESQRQHHRHLLVSQARQRVNTGETATASDAHSEGTPLAIGGQEDESGHPTPLAASQETFSGQRPTIASAAAPATPLHHQGLERYRQVPPGSAPVAAFSSTTTPDHSNGYRSPYYTSDVTPSSGGPGGSGRMPMQRGQSYQSYPGSGHPPVAHTQTFSQPLHEFWTYDGHEVVRGNGANAALEAHHIQQQQQQEQQQQQQQQEHQQGRMVPYGHGHSVSEQLQSPPGGLSLFHRRAQQSAMSRVASAPALATTPFTSSSSAPNLSQLQQNNHQQQQYMQHMQQHQHPPFNYSAWREGSVPTTPGSTVSWAATSSIPGTPVEIEGFTLSPTGYMGSGGLTHSSSVGALATSTASMAPFETPSRHPTHHFGGGGVGRGGGGGLDGFFSFPPPSVAAMGSVNGAPSKHIKKNSRSQSRGSITTTPRKHTSGRSQSGILGGGPAGSPPGPPLVVSSADKLHVCHCGKRFKRMEHLKRHNRTHTQERPHKCPIEGCGKYFGRTDNLSQHLKTHFRASGLAQASQNLLAMSSQQGHELGHLDIRHDPHAAASEAARAAIKAAEGAARRNAGGNTGGIGSGGGGDSDSSSGSPPSGEDEGEMKSLMLGGPISFESSVASPVTGGGAGSGMKQQQAFPPTSARSYHQQEDALSHFGQHQQQQYSYHHLQLQQQQQQQQHSHGLAGPTQHQQLMQPFGTRQVLAETNGAGANACPTKGAGIMGDGGGESVY